MKPNETSTSWRAHGLHGAITALALASALVLQTGCGGSPFVDIEETVNCAVTNCKDSELLQSDALSPHAIVLGQDGLLNVSVSVGQSANLLTRIRLTGADRIYAQTDSQRIELRDSDGRGSSYIGQLPSSQVQPSISIILERRGEQHVSSVTLPKSFSVLSPLGPVSLNRSAGKLMVQLGQEAGSSVDNRSNLRCKRADGSSFSGGMSDGVSLPFLIENQAGAPWVRINTLDLDLALNEHSRSLDKTTPNLSAVQSCEIDVSWRVYRMGSTASTLSRHTTVRGERAARQSIGYDARL